VHLLWNPGSLGQRLPQPKSATKDPCRGYYASTHGKQLAPVGPGSAYLGATSASLSNQFILPLTLHVSDKSSTREHHFRALIDSGASANFIHQDLASKWELPLSALPSPIPLRVIDGRPVSSGEMTHETVPLRCTMGAHQEYLSFLVTALGPHDVVLGLPWLRLHQPTFQWATDTLRFDSQYCLGRCLDTPAFTHSTDTIGDEGEPRVAATIDQKDPTHLVPRQYHDFLDVFSKARADTLPPHREFDHRIPLLPDSKPPTSRVYNMSALELKALKEHIDENLAKGFIVPSQSPASSSVLFVKKKDGSLRLCVDYRKLNAMTIRNKCPLPLIPELLDRLQGARVFSKIDLRNAYNLVRVATEDEWKTAFSCRYGHYQYRVMPFGLTNAPATFQQFIQHVLDGLLDRQPTGVAAYLDDIILWSPDEKSHITLLREVLQRLRSFQLYAKAEKCEFHKDSVEFLGYRVSPNEVSMDHSKVKAVLEWPTPTTLKQLQSFLGFANFYRRFIRNYSGVVRPLTSLTRRGSFAWGAQATAAFANIKQRFASAPVLQQFDPTKPITLETDASDYALACILSQPDDQGQLHPVVFHSRQFHDAELNYPIYDKEMLAIITACKVWRHYLEGSPYRIEIITDHKNLEFS